MSTRTAPKTPYEIRLELLQLAFEILHNKHAAEGASANSTRPAATTSPTTEEVIAEAEKMNGFISKANQSSH
jgi:hypothetical protein